MADLFENPIGLDGFEFVEFSHPDPQELRDLFARMGYAWGREQEKAKHQQPNPNCIRIWVR